MIVYCDAGPSWLIRTACKCDNFYHGYHICHQTFLFRDDWALLKSTYMFVYRYSYMFLASIWPSLCHSMYRCIPGFVHSGITRFKLGCLRTSLLTVLRVVHAIGRSLAQARPWFWSSMWISSIGGISTYSEQIFIWHTTATVFTRWYSTGRCY